MFMDFQVDFSCIESRHVFPMISRPLENIAGIPPRDEHFPPHFLVSDVVSAIEMPDIAGSPAFSGSLTDKLYRISLLLGQDRSC